MSQNFSIPEHDTPDLPPMGPPMSGVAQHLSPEVMADSDKFIPDLLAGDIFLRYISGGVSVVKGQTGFTGVIVGCEPSVSEYEPGESGRYVDTYAKRPATRASPTRDAQVGISRTAIGLSRRSSPTC